MGCSFSETGSISSSKIECSSSDFFDSFRYTQQLSSNYLWHLRWEDHRFILLRLPSLFIYKPFFCIAGSGRTMSALVAPLISMTPNIYSMFIGSHRPHRHRRRNNNSISLDGRHLFERYIFILKLKVKI